MKTDKLRSVIAHFLHDTRCVHARIQLHSCNVACFCWNSGNRPIQSMRGKSHVIH